MLIVVVFLVVCALLGVGLIVEGVKENKQYSNEKPTIVKGTLIRNDEREQNSQSGSTGKRRVYYTPIYQYEYCGLREVRGPMTTNRPGKLGVTCNIYIYDDGVVTFYEKSILSGKVLFGLVFLLGCVSVLYLGFFG